MHIIIDYSPIQNPQGLMQTTLWKKAYINVLQENSGKLSTPTASSPPVFFTLLCANCYSHTTGRMLFLHLSCPLLHPRSWNGHHSLRSSSAICLAVRNWR